MEASVKNWHDIGTVEQLERDGRLIARVGGREIGVVSTPDGLRALRNRCPHQGGALCLGTVAERLVGSPGRYQLGGTTMLRCPWHGWEFSVESGLCADDPSKRVATYPVRVDDGRVLVET